ncbi:MFS general substrate transporter [Exidia glandulosa HHB12029]|uniref:MFS general substrate transporter n=1 Tax=Exidia glandulosa HHB12029 TaxID=1314781 RepID=A0A166A884_EXIGL|nr:MFS general substrate transporter [Exidia glandulosa HHB12029]
MASTSVPVRLDEKRPSDVDIEKDTRATQEDAPHAAPGVAEAAGVARMEALYRVFGKGGASIWLLYGSLALISYAYSLAGNTVYNYLAFATSAFGKHSLLAAIDTACTRAYVHVGKPFIAKLADITSRPIAYAVSLGFYVVGFIIVATASGVGAVAAGELFYNIGSVGLDLVTDIIIADLTPLQWRGLVGSLTTSPYIINAYISGFIVDGLGPDGWRWGYGMFAIIMPAVIAPALVVLFWADWKAKRLGVLSLSASSYVARTDVIARKSWVTLVVDFVKRVDGLGLLLLGTSWTLLFLPFSLKSGAKGGYDNPSLIAMFAVGGVTLVAFGLWEWFGTAHPILPRRILNKTFCCGVVIDVLYMLSGTMRSTYWGSWSYVVTNWSTYTWTIFSNTLTVGLCVFGLVAGVIMRYTHRFKWMQISGICIRCIGLGLTYWARGSNASDVALAWTQILTSWGSAFSVVGTRVATQASVPHDDLASVIANLALWSKLGSATGAAIGTDNMPRNLRTHLTPLGVSAAEIQKIFGSIRTAKLAKPAVRAAVIEAYDETVRPLYLGALILGA